MGLGDRHVVRDVVDDHPEPPVGGSVEQCRETVVATELGADAGVVDHVVAVQAARNRLRDRRQVQVAHAEAHQVVEDPDRVGESERGRQLDAVRGHRVREVGVERHLVVLPGIDPIEPAAVTGGAPSAPVSHSDPRGTREQMVV